MKRCMNFFYIQRQRITLCHSKPFSHKSTCTFTILMWIPTSWFSWTCALVYCFASNFLWREKQLVMIHESSFSRALLRLPILSHASIFLHVHHYNDLNSQIFKLTKDNLLRVTPQVQLLLFVIYHVIVKSNHKFHFN